MHAFKIIRTSIISLVTIGSVLSPALAQAATAPRIYFENTSLSAAKGTNINLELRLDAAGVAINAANVVITYPEDQLTFAGLDKNSSSFDTFVPASPQAADGKVSFGIASLGKTTNTDSLVSHVLFTAKGASGVAKVALDGSEASNGGSKIALEAAGASVNLLASGDTSASTLAITGIDVTDKTTSQGVVRWHTAVPASSSVDYGGTDTYGLTAGTEGLTTDHVVKLASVFSGKTVVHFKVTSVSADNKAGVSNDQTFTTKGYSVDITVQDKSGKPIVGAEVRVGDSDVVETDGNGVASVENVAGGNQKVYIDDAEPQIITVKDATGKAGAAHQEFKLVAKHHSTISPMGLLALLFVVLAAVLYWAWRRRNVPPQA